MPRTARKKSNTGIYHVMLSGINQQRIFEDDEDNEKFLLTLSDCKKAGGFELYGYCLMGNHVHLLIKVAKEELEQIFRRIEARYVYWYNWKYKRSGHLFQDRYKSEPVEDDRYFVSVLRYIHQNPVKAKLCKKPEEYKWSSYSTLRTHLHNKKHEIQIRKVLSSRVCAMRRRAAERFFRFTRRSDSLRPYSA